MSNKPRDRWVPWLFVAFFIGLAMIDGVFVYLATSTHTGVITENSYQKGLDYNDQVEALDQQEMLGIQSRVVVSDDGILHVYLIQKNGDVLEDAEVLLYAIRPVQSGYDFMMKTKEVTPGKYVANSEFPMLGQWIIRVVALIDGHHYQRAHRVVVHL